MYGEAKKLHLIEELLKVENDAVLSEVEHILLKNKLVKQERKKFTDFAGMMTDEEADELEKIIKEGCEQIHPDDWK